MSRVEQLFHLRRAVLFLAAANEFPGIVEIIDYAFGIGPLPEQMVVLEEMIVATGRMRHDQRLHCHRVLVQTVADAGVGVDDDLIGQTAEPAAVAAFMKNELFSKRPVPVHQRHARRGIGVQHLFRRDDLDLVRVKIKPEIFQRDRLDCVIGPADGIECPFAAFEQQFVGGGRLSHRGAPIGPKRVRETPGRCPRAPQPV